MGKGHWVRPRRISREQYAENFERIFGCKRLNEEDADGIQGDAGDGARDKTDSECDSDVPQEPDGQPDPQATEPVEPPLCGNCGSRDYTPGGGYCDSCEGAF